MKRQFSGPFFLAICLTGIALAQPQQPVEPNADPGLNEPDGQYEQGRGVARISVLNGDVSVRRGDSGDVVQAGLNAPLMADDRLLTSSNARAEVQLDWGNMLRVGPNSEVRFAELDPSGFQIQIAAGTVTLRVLRPSQAQTDLNTPSISVRPLGLGVYRISVREDGTSEITLRAGQAEAYSPRGTERLNVGRTMYARGNPNDPEFQITDAIPLDGWDRWNEDRDQYLQRSHAYDHVSRDIPGAEDLDQNGQWVNDPEYGNVWSPNVGADWAPYRDGRWAWEDYYGWTWVSADPWGWAPYHYGRWFHGGRGWCWYPGPLYARNFWAPAYVGFFGWGGHGGVGFGFGGLGWVPLAPYERFHPWWGRGVYAGFRSGGFGRNTVIINNANIAGVYRNARFAGGATGVNASEFGRRGGRFTSLDHNQIREAGLVRGVVPVSPDRSSLRMTDRNVTGNFRQNNVSSFASRGSSRGVEHVGFEQQQRGIQQISRGNFGSVAGNPNAGGWQRVGGATDRGGAPNLGGVNSPSGQGNPGSVNPGNHGWGRFGEPIHGTGGGSANSSFQNSRSAQALGGRSVDGGNQGSWQRFDTQRQGVDTSRTNFTGSGSQPVRISPQMVQRAPNYGRPMSSQPSYQPAQRQPSYQSTPRYEAPRNYSQPSNSAPRNFGGGGGGNRGNGGAGGSRGSSGGHSNSGGSSHGNHR